jgi:hypothetical protein
MRTDRRTEMTKPIDALRHFAKAPNNHASRLLSKPLATERLWGTAMQLASMVYLTMFCLRQLKLKMKVASTECTKGHIMNHIFSGMWMQLHCPWIPVSKNERVQNKRILEMM